MGDPPSQQNVIGSIVTPQPQPLSLVRTVRMHGLVYCQQEGTHRAMSQRVDEQEGAAVGLDEEDGSVFLVAQSTVFPEIHLQARIRPQHARGAVCEIEIDPDPDPDPDPSIDPPSCISLAALPVRAFIHPGGVVVFIEDQPAHVVNKSACCINVTLPLELWTALLQSGR